MDQDYLGKLSATIKMVAEKKITAEILEKLGSLDRSSKRKYNARKYAGLDQPYPRFAQVPWCQTQFD